jgi:hypothetical protein
MSKEEFMKTEMTAKEFADIIIHLPVEQQNEFLASLKEMLTEEEYKATATFISLWSMFNSPAKYNAMKEACKEALVEKFYGHPYEKGCSTQEGIYSYHPQSICDIPVLIGVR